MTTMIIRRGQRGRTKLVVDLWKEGRSVAGVIMEVEESFGFTFKPSSLLRQLRRLREGDRSIPPARHAGTGDLLDMRASW